MFTPDPSDPTPDLTSMSPGELCELVQRLEAEIQALEIQRCQLATLKRHVLAHIYRGDSTHAPRFRLYPTSFYATATALS